MAHELTLREDGFTEMAFIGATPWHGLGQQLQRGATIEQWRHSAGLNWDVRRSIVQYENGDMHQIKNQHVLYRSDNNSPLAIVSDRYQIVQPDEVLCFFKDLVSQYGFEIETAGTMKGGKRIWALARTHLAGEVVPNDELRTYLLLATSYDGGLATTAQFTSIRVVCNNTLQMSLFQTDEANNRIKVRHNTVFDPVAVKLDLGLTANSIYSQFMSKMQEYSNKSLSLVQTKEVIEHVFAKNLSKREICELRGYKTVMRLFNGDGKGSQLDGVAGTGWGAINAVTEYVDFNMRGSNDGNRLNSAWFGPGAELKIRVLEAVEGI